MISILVVVNGGNSADKIKDAGYRVLNVGVHPQAINKNWEEIDRFKKFIFVGLDNDQELKKILKKVGRWRSFKIDKLPQGKEEIIRAISNAEAVKIAGAVALSSIGRYQPDQIEHIPSTIRDLNKIFRGYPLGKLSVLVGGRGAGKSTFATQELLAATAAGYTSFIYSSEFCREEVKYWIDIQLAGPDFIDLVTDDYGNMMPFVPDEYKKSMENWYRNKIFIFDENEIDADDPAGLVEIMTEVYKRYNCRFFVIDNLSAAMYAGEDYKIRDNDFYRKQARFTHRLKKFASHYHTHVLLLTHPRKGSEERYIIDHADQISGGSGIADFADIIFSIGRVPEKTKDQLREAGEDAHDTIILELKNRMYGCQDRMVGLQFHVDTKRLYQSEDELYKNYGWNNEAQGDQRLKESECDADNVPF